MARYQSMIVAALLRASRRFTSPVIARTLSSSSSSLLPKPNFTLPPSSPFYAYTCTFSSSSSSSSSSIPLPKTAPSDSDVADTFQNTTTDDVEVIDEWEDDDDAEPVLGDGRGGGGVVLGNVPWGERALSTAADILKQSHEDLQLFAFRITPSGDIYIRLDKLSNKYGCPTMDELNEFRHEFDKRLDDVVAVKQVREDLIFEVSSPGAERLLRVPEDLHRFKEIPMTVSYVEKTDNSSKGVKSAVFLLESVDAETKKCIWKLADVRENREPESKGRPLSQKQRDLRIKLPFTDHTKISLYLMENENENRSIMHLCSVLV